MGRIEVCLRDQHVALVVPLVPARRYRVFRPARGGRWLGLYGPRCRSAWPERRSLEPLVLNLERETRLELATICLGRTMVGAIAKAVDSKSAGILQGKRRSTAVTWTFGRAPQPVATRRPW
jgi:hypothetical protein